MVFSSVEAGSDLAVETKKLKAKDKLASTAYQYAEREVIALFESTLGNRCERFTQLCALVTAEHNLTNYTFACPDQNSSLFPSGSWT